MNHICFWAKREREDEREKERKIGVEDEDMQRLLT